MTKDDHENKRLCDGCSACCEYISMELDEPEDKNDYENFLWYLFHQNVRLYIDHEDGWYIEFRTRCKKLGADLLCKVYQKRPNICKEHDQGECEKGGNPYQVLFLNAEDFIAWVRKNTKYKDFFT